MKRCGLGEPIFAGGLWRVICLYVVQCPRGQIETRRIVHGQEREALEEVEKTLQHQNPHDVQTLSRCHAGLQRRAKTRQILAGQIKRLVLAGHQPFPEDQIAGATKKEETTWRQKSRPSILRKRRSWN